MGFLGNTVMNRESIYILSMMVSCVVYLLMYFFVNPMLSKHLFYSSYSKLMPAKRIDWDSRINSNINAVSCCSLCILGFAFDGRSLYEDAISGDSFYVKMGCSLLIGYSVADLFIVFLHWKSIGEIGFVLHHLSAIVAYYLSVTDTVFVYFANWRMVSEFSTVFVNNRWYLDSVKYDRKSNVFIANGLAMTASFFLARVAIMPYYWAMVFTWYNHPKWKQISWRAELTIIVSCFVLDVVNIYWMSKMFRGSMKVINSLLEGSSQKSIEVNQNATSQRPSMPSIKRTIKHD